MKETVKDGIFILLVILGCAYAAGCATPHISIASDLHASAVAAHAIVREQVMPALRSGGPDAQKIYSAATAQLFLCRQKSIETLKTFALGNKDEEAQRLYDDAIELCTWKAPAPLPMAGSGPMVPGVTIPAIPVAP